MPRKGYRSITMPDSLYRTLCAHAEMYGTSPQKMLSLLLNSPSEVYGFDDNFLQKFQRVEGATPTLLAKSGLSEKHDAYERSINIAKAAKEIVALKKDGKLARGFIVAKARELGIQHGYLHMKIRRIEKSEKPVKMVPSRYRPREPIAARRSLQ